MEPIPETTQAIGELDAFVADDDLLDQLVATSAEVRAIVPECVGMSLTMLDHGVTFTLVASAEEIAALDAVQYVASGPCVTAVERGEVIAAQHDTMSEAGWQLFADATAARGVASTLSMPVMGEDRVLGGVNLYAATPRAFDHHHDELAGVLGTWAGGAVTNADLPFSTRDTARLAPQLLRDAASVDVAVGLLAGRLGAGIEESRDRLEVSAARAGLPLAAVARLVVEVLAPGDA